jgi:uncharacterized protein (DUF1501 family)
VTISRRAFIRDGVVLTAAVAAHGFLADVLRAQGTRSRALVVLDLLGGNDSLSEVVPYTDPFYYSRRPTIAIPPSQVLPIGSDSSGKALGLHPRLTGLRGLYDEGTLAIVQRVGYPNSSRSHFLGTDIWSTANSTGTGWLGRYLDARPSPTDPLVAWNTAGDLPRTLRSDSVSVATIPSAPLYTYQAANTGGEAVAERATATKLASNPAPGRPLVAFVNDSIESALATIDRVAGVATYTGTVAYPTTSFALALRTIAGALARGIGTQVFFVQTGGYDTHANQGVVEATGTYRGLMGTLDGALQAFASDLRNLGLWDSTLLLQFSEFGRRIAENGSRGTDHGAASVMLALGGAVRGGLYGTAPNLDPSAQNPTLENNGGDVRFETDFRSVYARVLDSWLAADSVRILGGNFRAGAPQFL